MQKPNYQLYLINFIFNEVPDHVSKNLVLCSLHFTADSLTNKVWFDAGFSERLKLKDNVVPYAIFDLTVIGFAWQYSQACGHPCGLCSFTYPISSFQSTLYLICFDTALLEQPPLSVMTLCDLPSLWRVSMIVFWTIASQQCSPLLWFQRTRDTQNWYCMDCHLLKLKCKYSNILRYWFFTLISYKL